MRTKHLRQCTETRAEKARGARRAGRRAGAALGEDGAGRKGGPEICSGDDACADCRRRCKAIPITRPARPIRSRCCVIGLTNRCPRRKPQYFEVKLDYYPMDAARVSRDSRTVTDPTFWEKLAKSINAQADQQHKRENLIQNLRQQAGQLSVTGTLMGTASQGDGQRDDGRRGRSRRAVPRLGNPGAVGGRRARGHQARDPDEIATMPGCSDLRF